MSCQHEELTWSDCRKDGHDNGCFSAECVSCSLVMPDCESNEDDCEKCLGVIEGGNPFSRFCDACLAVN
jgi:hypothetical protein